MINHTNVRIPSYSGPHFPAFGLNTERYGEILRISPYSVRMRENAGKMRTTIAPNMEIFYAVNSWEKRRTDGQTDRQTDVFKHIVWFAFCHVFRDCSQISFLILSKIVQIYCVLFPLQLSGGLQSVAKYLGSIFILARGMGTRLSTS